MSGDRRAIPLDVSAEYPATQNNTEPTSTPVLIRMKTYLTMVAFAIALPFSVRPAAAQQPPQSRLALSEVEEWPFSYNVLARPSSAGFDIVPILQFRATSTGGTKMFQRVYVEVTGSTSVHLMYLDYASGAGVSATSVQNGTNDDIGFAVDIAETAPQTFTVSALFREDAPAVSPVFRAKITEFAYFTYEPNYQTVYENVSLQGPTLHCFAKCIDCRSVGPNIISLRGGMSGMTASATFPLTFKALGGIADAPKAADFTIVFTDVLSGQQYKATEMSLAQDVSTPVPDGTARDLVVTASLSGSHIRADGLYHAKISGIRWRMNGATAVAQDWGLEHMVTPVTNTSMPAVNALDILASRLGDPDQNRAMIIAAPNQGFSIESSGNLSDWTNLGLPIGTTEVAVLPNRLKVFRVPMSATTGSSRGFLKVTRP